MTSTWPVSVLVCFVNDVSLTSFTFSSSRKRCQLDVLSVSSFWKWSQLDELGLCSFQKRSRFDDNVHSLNNDSRSRFVSKCFLQFSKYMDYTMGKYFDRCSTLSVGCAVDSGQLCFSINGGTVVCQLSCVPVVYLTWPMTLPVCLRRASSAFLHIIFAFHCVGWAEGWACMLWDIHLLISALAPLFMPVGDCLTFPLLKLCVPGGSCMTTLVIYIVHLLSSSSNCRLRLSRAKRSLNIDAIVYSSFWSFEIVLR